MTKSLITNTNKIREINESLKVAILAMVKSEDGRSLRAMEGNFFDVLEQEGISPESSANEVEDAIRNLAKKFTIETTNVGRYL